jgi:PAS domain-containing protein
MLLLTSLLFLMLAGSFAWRQWQQRVLARQQLQEEIEFHRLQVLQLGADHNSLKAAFGQLEMALMVFGNQQQLMFCNDACTKLLETTATNLQSLKLSELIPAAQDSFWQAWQQEMPIEQWHIELEDWQFQGRFHHLSLQINALYREEQLIVVVFNPQKPQFPTLAPDSQTFSQQLVDLMLSSLAGWEEGSRSTRIELAEKSGIWRVSIDDGRIRTRSLDRYLSVKTLPKNPRWREVLRTAHFVLANCPLSTERKDEISEKLARLTQQIRANSL